MPVYDITSPDGRTFEVTAPEGATENEVLAYAQSQYTKLAPAEKPDTGFTGAVKSSWESLQGDVAALEGKLGIKDMDEAQKEVQEHKRKAQAVFQPTTKGWTEAPFEKFKETLGGSLPYMAAPMVAGASAFVLPEAAIAGGLITTADLLAGAAGVAQFTGSNLSRQMDEGKRLEQTNLLAAGAAAVPQAALDVFGFHMIPGVRKIFGEAGMKISEKEAQDIVKTGLLSSAGQMVKSGAKAITAEGLAEAGQQVFERLQAGLSITDPQARQEYFDNFIAGGVLGGFLAVPGHLYEKSAAKGKAPIVPDQPLPLQNPPETAPPTAEPVTQAGLTIPEEVPPEVTPAELRGALEVPELPKTPEPVAPTQQPAVNVYTPPAVQPEVTPAQLQTPEGTRFLPSMENYHQGLPQGSELVFQNRDRSTPASIEQMNKIAAAPDYDRVSQSNDFGTGAPVVISDMKIPDDQIGRQSVATLSNGTKVPVFYAVVSKDAVAASNFADGTPDPRYQDMNTPHLRAIAGNGRIAGLSAAYERGTAEDYKNRLTNDAFHGVDKKVVEGIKDPVLVRVMPKSAVTPNIADLSNISGVSQLSASEKARNDSKRIDIGGLQFNEDGTPTQESIRQFVNAMPVEEHPELMDKKGTPSAQAYDRIANAVFHSAYDSDSLINLYAQAADPEAKTILNALAKVAPKMAALKGAGEYDVRNNVVQAAEIAVNARRQGQDLKQVAAQGDINVDPNVNHVVGMFADHARSAKRISEKLAELADRAYESANAKPDIFGQVNKVPVDELYKSLRETPTPAAAFKEEAPKQNKEFHIDKTPEQINQEIKGYSIPELAVWAYQNAPHQAAKMIAEKVLKRINQFSYRDMFPEPIKILENKRGSEWGGTRGSVHTTLAGPNRQVKFRLELTGLKNGKAVRGTGLNYQTILHELMHIATNAELRVMEETSPIAADLKKVLNAVRREVRKDQKSGRPLHPALKSIPTQGWIEGANTLKNIRELVSWGMTNADFQDYLSNIKVGKSNLLTDLVTAIRKLLGIEPEYETALDAVVRHTETILDKDIEQLEKEINAAGKSLRGGFDVERIPNITYVDEEGTPSTERLTKTAGVQTAGQRIREVADTVQRSWNDSGFWTKVRNAWVDKTSSLTKTLESQPTFDPNGQLRADMVARSQAQTINLIRNGLQTGIPVLNSDGTIGIELSENNLARSQILADALDKKALTGFEGGKISGRDYVAEVARAKRGEEILQEDEQRRALGRQQLKEAKQAIKDAKSVRKALDDYYAYLHEIEKDKPGKSKDRTPEQRERVAEMKRIQNNLIAKAKYLRRKGYENKSTAREFQVDQARIDWANEQLRKTPELDEIFKIWKNVNDSLVSIWRDTGLLTEEQADYYHSKRSYVPLFKAAEDLEDQHTGYGGTGLKSTKELKRLRGSMAVRNIWENMDKHYARMISAAYQNQTRKVAVEQLKSLDAARIPDNPNDPLVNLRYRDPSSPFADNKGIVSAIVENPNDLAAFQMMHYELGPILKMFAGSTKVLRAGALMNPMYWIKQLVRDPIHASIVADSGIVTPLHAMKEYINILANNSREAKILAQRGVIGQVDTTIDIHDFMKQVGKEKTTPSMLDKAIHKMMQMHEASDAATRVAIYKQAEKQALSRGMSKEDAMNLAVHKARESINFQVHGNSPTLNALRNMVPFLSASITSLDTVYRAATGYGKNPEEKAQAQRLFYQRAAMMAVMASAYAMLYQDDEDYKKLPDYVKDGYWLIKNPLGDGKSFIRLPVPYEVGFLFKTIPETLVRYMAGNSTGKEVLASYIMGVGHNLPGNALPPVGIIPQAFKPILESITNYSFFTGRPIENMGDQGLPVAARGTNASEAAKVLSKMGLDKIGLSPAKIDNLIQGYFAELGTFSTGMVSSAIYAAEGKEPPAKNIEQMPFFKAFMTNPATSKAVADFYDLNHNAQEAVQELNALKGRGDVEGIKELLSDEQKKHMIAAAPALRQVGEQMKNIRKQIQYYTENQKMDPEMRRQKINALQQQFNTVAERGYKIAEAAKINR